MIPAIQMNEEAASPLRVASDFYLEPTSTTPLIQFNPEQGVLDFKGKSSPENAPRFYETVHEWFEMEAFRDSLSLTVNMSLDYFNTSSCKCLFIIFKKLNEFRQDGLEISVNWYFEEDDDDMQEAGEDFSEIFNLDFNLIEVED